MSENVQKDRRSHPACLLIAVGALVVCCGVLVVVRYLPRGLPSGSDIQQFDDAAWVQEENTQPSDGISERQKMLSDLVKNVLPGRTREEIQSMLGPSLDTPYFQSTGRDLIYVLGPERDNYFAIDSEWLLLWLDEEGIFERYQVVVD